MPNHFRSQRLHKPFWPSFTRNPSGPTLPKTPQAQRLQEPLRPNVSPAPCDPFHREHRSHILRPFNFSSTKIAIIPMPTPLQYVFPYQNIATTPRNTLAHESRGTLSRVFDHFPSTTPMNTPPCARRDTFSRDFRHFPSTTPMNTRLHGSRGTLSRVF